MLGQYIHGYQINANLGEGGMGKVFRATDGTLAREVALKMLHPNLTRESMFLERFKKEARVLARLLHPNIAVIYNFIEQDGGYFMVMEYVEGSNLDEFLKQFKTLPLSVVVPAFIQALEGLQHAHKKNILHRDIKPSNMMITPEGNLKLMDFGIAKIANEQKITQINKIVGTVEFMAPELIEGKEASVSSDIYAMGIALYEVVAGKLPFENDTDFNLMQSILKKKPVAPVKLNASIPQAISDIILKSIEKRPEHRYPDARAFQKALLDAFPRFREIDLNVLSAPVNPVNYGNAEAMTRIDRTGMQTRLESTQATALADKPLSGEWWRTQRVPLMIAGGGLLAFIIFILSIVIHKNKLVVISAVDTVNKNAQRASITKVQPVTVAPENIQQPLVKPIESLIVTDPPSEPVPTRKKKSAESLTHKVDPVQREEPSPNTQVEKPVEKKEIIIPSKVEVELYLRDNVNTGSDEREQNIVFSVSSPVSYEGVTIIRQGATANGTIRIGRVMTSININTVVAANGQLLKFKSDRIHRKKNNLSSDRNYTAVLEKGAKLVL